MNIGRRAALALLTPLMLPQSVKADNFRGKTIRVQFWGSTDGLAVRKYIVDPFVERTGAQVVVEEGGTAASIAKVKAQKADPQLDVVLCDDIGVVTLQHEGLLDKLDLARMTYAKDIYPSYIIAGGYGIGIFTYIMTVLYNPKLTGEPTSWNDFWNPQFKNKVLSPSISDTAGLLFTIMAAKLNGGGLDNLAPAWPKLQAFRPNVYAFIQNYTLDADALKSGAAVIGAHSPSFWKPFIEHGYPITFATALKEGYFSIPSAACLVKGGKGDLATAYAFIDQALTPEAQAGIATSQWYGPTNPNTKIPEDVKAYMVTTPEQYAKAISIDSLKLLAERPTIIQKWNEIMTT
jgi:putative spermidine/putrescine transport system substrate-binding protein